MCAEADDERSRGPVIKGEPERFTEILQQRRIAAGFSEHDLAMRVGTTRERIVAWENGGDLYAGRRWARRLLPILGGKIEDYLAPDDA